MSELASHFTLDLLHRIGIALGLTIAWVVILLILFRIGGAFRDRVRHAMMAWVERHKLSRFLQRHSETPVLFVDGLLKFAGALLVLVVSYEWLVQVLSQFEPSAEWATDLNDALITAFSLVGSAILDAIPNFVVVLVIALITVVLVKVSNAFFRLVERGHVRFEKLDAEAARATRKLVTFALWLFALVMAYPYLPGSQSDAFKGVSVLLGLMVSLGSSSIVAQAFSGLILIYSRALRPGEYVKIGEAEGTVLEVGLFATHIGTGTGERIVLPNSQVVAGATHNYSRPAPGGKFVLATQVSIGYDTPWRQVHAILLEAGKRTPGITTEPAPFVLQMALSDFYVQYRLVAYSDIEGPAQRAKLTSVLLGNVQDVFNEYGVQIMSPHYFTQPDQPQVVPKSQWYAAPATPPQDAGPKV
jgi:small-conductance mechanosensitive channel